MNIPTPTYVTRHFRRKIARLPGYRLKQFPHVLVVGRRRLVVSGLKGHRIFYRKVALTCDKQMWEHIAFEYSAETKRVCTGARTEMQLQMTDCLFE